MAAAVHGDWWRAVLVRPAGGGDRRRPADVVRLVAGGSAVAALLTLVTRAPMADHGLTRWLAELDPDRTGIVAAGRLVLLAVPAAVAVIAVVTRSWRLLFSAALAALTSLAVSGALVPLATPAPERAEALAALGIAGSFPFVAVAVPVAVLTVARAFLARPVRRILGGALGVGVAALVLGQEGLLFDVLASAAVGWAAAGLAGLLFGAPVGDATPESVVRQLDDLGVAATAAVALGHPVWGTARYRVQRSAGGPVLVDVHGREAQDARALERSWHAVVDKGGRGVVPMSRRTLAEHEALCLALAERADVPVPPLVAVGVAGPAEDGFVVTADTGARALRSVDEVDDAFLGSAWAAVAATHRAGLAHGLLDGAAIEIRPDGSAHLTDWFAAASGAVDAARDRDVATALLATGSAAGADRAVAAAVAAVGPDAVARALPLCQLAVLARRARGDVSKAVAADVRAAGAAALGVEPPELAGVRRVSLSDLLMLVGTVFGFWLLYSQLASLGDIRATLAGADGVWLVVVLVLAQVSVVGLAVGLRAAVPVALPLGRMVALQYADLFTGLVGGTVAITATNIRFFQRQGVPPATAVTAGVASSLAGGVVQTVVIGAAIISVLGDGQIHLDDTGGGGAARIFVLGLLVVALVSGVVFLVPRFRALVVRKVRPGLHRAGTDIRALVHRPARLATMLGGQVVSQLAQAVALGAALHAFGASLPLFELLLVNSVASLIGGLAPVPGGLGAVEAGLIGGLTAMGVDATVAGAATFAYRLLTAYLPPAWGWPTLAWMRRHELL